ncbi:hypothetical protein QQG55_28690 [Brugia pahangi]
MEANGIYMEDKGQERSLVELPMTCILLVHSYITFDLIEKGKKTSFNGKCMKQHFSRHWHSKHKTETFQRKIDQQ